MNSKMISDEQREKAKRILASALVKNRRKVKAKKHFKESVFDRIFRKISSM